MRGTVVGLVLAGLLPCVPIAARAQTIESGPVRLRISGRVQTQFNTTSVGESDLAAAPGLPAAAPVAATTFETRRARIGLDVRIDDWIRGRIEPDFALGRVRLTYAWADFEVDPAFAVRIGQFKKPFGRIFLTSSAELPVIERGLRIRGAEEAYRREAARAGFEPPAVLEGAALIGEAFHLLDGLGYLDIDLGAEVHGESGRWGYAAGVFNGAGQDRRDENDAKSFAGRATYRPSSAPLTFGAAASYRETRFTGELDGEPVVDAKLDGVAWMADAEYGGFRRPGLWLIAEAATGENLLARERFVGAQAIASYFFPRPEGRRVEGIEPALRVSWADPNTASAAPGAGVLITPGLNVHFAGRNRMQFNWDAFVPSGGALRTEHAFRAQAQVAF